MPWESVQIEPKLTVEEAAEWAKPYGFGPETTPCIRCGKEQTTTIPWRGSGWVGLLAPLHECGERYQLKVLIEGNLRKRIEWKKAVQKLKDYLRS